MNNESEEATAIPVLDAGWEIHEIVQTLSDIPPALSMASDNAANNATLRHPHDANAHRRALRRLDRSLHCLLYTSPSPRDRTRSRMPSSA